MPPFIDLSGQTFGRLTVLHRVENKQYGKTIFLCKCSCGKESVVNSPQLKNGSTQSCGCLHQEIRSKLLTTHGMSKTHLYRTWKSMMSRCYNAHTHAYKNYGGRGITVYEQWHDFLKWKDYMGDKPSPKHTIERINNNGNYEPGNVKWSTRKEQANNTRRNHIIEFNGQTKTVRQWSEHTGIPYKTLYARLQYCWDVERALTTPLKYLKKRIVKF